MEQTMFAKNLEFIRTSLGLSQSKFCGKVDSDSDAVLSISENTYVNYIKNLTTPTMNNQTIILAELNEAIAKHSVLSLRFPKGILNNELMNEDLEKMSRGFISEVVQYYFDKILGAYFCYYMSTNIDGAKALNYGILVIEKTKENANYSAKGLFSIDSFDKLHDAYEKIEHGKQLEDVLADDEAKFFFGDARVSTDVVWISVSSTNKNEHFAMSFDISPKIMTKNPDKEFIGCRGIALSQSVGQRNKTTAFPIVITKKPIVKSSGELCKYLHFSYTQIEDSQIDALSDNVVNLLEDMLKLDSFNEQLRRNVVSINIKNGIKRILNSAVFNSHYYLSKEMEEFYIEIIRPLREENPEE